MQGTVIQCCGGRRRHPDDQDGVSALEEVLAHCESSGVLCKHTVKKVLSVWGIHRDRGD